MRQPAPLASRAERLPRTRLIEDVRYRHPSGRPGRRLVFAICRGHSAEPVTLLLAR